jgi:hypothetical protein
MNQLLAEIASIINDLNSIPSPTDGEGRLIQHIIDKYVRPGGLDYCRGEGADYLAEPYLLIGDKEAKYLLVTHCDRVNENTRLEFDYLRYVNGRPVNEERKLTGKLDNSSCLAVGLYFMLTRQAIPGSDVALLVTTSEEGPPQGRALAATFPHGGRGFIHFLDNNRSAISRHCFICLDVRPIPMEELPLVQLGSGLVLRLAEYRGGQHLVNADPDLLTLLKGCAQQNGIRTTDFEGTRGITEIGRGYEFIRDHGLPGLDYRVAWIQPPIEDYHTTNERMSGTDLVRLYNILMCINERVSNAGKP